MIVFWFMHLLSNNFPLDKQSVGSWDNYPRWELEMMPGRKCWVLESAAVQSEGREWEETVSPQSLKL